MKSIIFIVGFVSVEALAWQSTFREQIHSATTGKQFIRSDHAFLPYKGRSGALSNRLRSHIHRSSKDSSQESDETSKESFNSESQEFSMMLQPPSRTGSKDNNRKSTRQRERHRTKLKSVSRLKSNSNSTKSYGDAILPPISLDGSNQDKVGNKFSRMQGQKFKSRKQKSKRPIESLTPPLFIKSEGEVISDEPALTSWDEFFSKPPTSGLNVFTKPDYDTNSNLDLYDETSYGTTSGKIGDLPSPSYLFGDGIKSNVDRDSNKSGSTGSFLDGVLPVSELFYRSTQSISASDENDGENEMENQEKETDDEELPFSAEQSNQILTTNNKILVRRNIANRNQYQFPDEKPSLQDEAQYRTDIAKLRASGSVSASKDRRSGKETRRGKNGRRTRNDRSYTKGQGRKMVRRGMEMLVGGEPINADPPLRSVDLSYCLETANSLAVLGLEGSSSSKVNLPDWAAVVTTNSRDFGPLMHKSSVFKVSKLSREIYCEHFVSSSIKWNVCPKDLKNLAKQYELSEIRFEPDDDKNIIGSYQDLVERVSNVEFVDSQPLEMKYESGMGFGKDTLPKRKHINTFQTSGENVETYSSNRKGKDAAFLGGELKFTLGVSRTELESGHDGGSNKHILRQVLGKGISNAIRAESLGFDVGIGNLVLNEVDGGSTEFRVEFQLSPNDSMKYGELEWAAKKINLALAQSMDDGEMALAMAAAAKDELAWPVKVRNRVVDEFLLEAEDIEDDRIDDDEEDDDLSSSIASSRLDDEDDFETQRENLEEDEITITIASSIGEDKNDLGFDGPFGMPGDTIYSKDDIFLGGGNGGVFPDYSPNGLSTSPYSGNLGPLLVDAVVQKALARQPRVIAIGDVHGCIDELQALLRRCDYRPGDLIVFLGDLVSKGPDSASVVQMARELGAIGVRGNHDFEVIRWHQAIKSGAEPPVIGSEHYQIASKLSTADMRWMYSLPWYISSKELNALFVHAGFVSGIRLGKQNPRLMMNMRSILPDGTVTSKFFNNWPWARLWDGPHTVLFGHDADRGLQQYEHAIGLDTGCVYGGRLTACILPEKRLVSVSAKKEYFQYRRKHFD